MSRRDEEREEYVRKVVDTAPPLRPDQIARLSALFDCAPSVADDQAGD